MVAHRKRYCPPGPVTLHVDNMFIPRSEKGPRGKRAALLSMPLMVTHIFSSDQGIGEVLLNQFLRGKAGGARDDLDAIFSKKG